MDTHNQVTGPGSSLRDALGRAKMNRAKRASHQVYEVIRNAIISLRLEPNLPLSEQEVASFLDVSRTPVREAFIRLSEEGLVTSYPQLSTVVSPIRMNALIDAQFLREAVESAIAAQAATKIAKDGAAALRHLFALHQKAYKEANWSEYYVIDDETHRLVAEIAGLSSVLEKLDFARAQLDRVRHLVLPDQDTAGRVIKQHKAFISAICAKNPELAREAMSIHTRDILTRLPALRSLHPELFEDRPAARADRPKAAAVMT